MTTSAAADSDDPFPGLREPDAAVRAAARDRAVRAGEASLPGLIRVLRGASTVAAREAALGLGEIGHPGAREALHGALKSESPLVRTAAAQALGRMGDFRDIEALEAAIPGAPVAAVRALVGLGEERAVAAVRGALPSLEGAARIEALAALARAGERGLLPELIGHLGADDPQRSRALARLREIAATDAGSDEDAWREWWMREALADRLGSTDPEALKASMDELLATTGQMRDAVVAHLLGFVAEPTRAAAVRERAILALGLLREKRAVDPLLAVLRGPGGQARCYAAEALGRIREPRVAADLAFQLLNAEDPDREQARRVANTDPYFIVDVESCKSLVRMGLRGGLRVAIENLFGSWKIRMYHEPLLLLRRVTGQNFGYRPDGSDEERYAAATRWLRWFREHRREIEMPAMIDPDDPALTAEIERLVKTMGVYKFLTSDTARRMLMILGEPARPRLEQAVVEDANSYVRAYAADVLGELGHPASGAALAEAILKDREVMVRTAAAEAMGRLGPRAAPATAPALREVVLRHAESDDVLVAVVEALGFVSDDPSSATLIGAALRARETPPEALRLAVARAIARIGRPEGLDLLLPFLGAEEPVVRRHAVEVLREVTGQDLGFDPEATAEIRDAAAARWRDHVRDHRRILPRGERGYVLVTFLTTR